MIFRALAFVLIACPAAAFTPPVEGEATVTRSADLPLDRVTLPLGAWTPEGFPTEAVEGRVTRTAWQTSPPEGFTTLSLLRPIREALLAEGWTLRLDCGTDDCGGYDFRYSVSLFPEPEMHVDLGDFRYMTAAKEEGRIGVMVSRTADLGFIEVVQVQPTDAAPATAPAPVPEPEPERQAQDGLPRVLEGLAFAAGSASLSGDQPVLAQLLDWLNENPGRSITLVGHTDASGGREVNVALSQARAGAVRDWLIGQGIAADRLQAEGVGPFAPRDTNATEAGRERNRRVEVLAD
ncbi:OmpA family protein [Falsirhodobacter deserti]|uniref:OmpA family protein n=1 Tax=Falsirhodobacter deserti TaxID=1365611 RepID=UPI0013E2A450|nr:OmpA family protein [Falsirhodobacter deserti]